MNATRNEIRLSKAATLHREVDGEWELWLFVDDPDDLWIVKLTQDGQETVGRIHNALVEGEAVPM
jgi:hypothetical protein